MPLDLFAEEETKKPLDLFAEEPTQADSFTQSLRNIPLGGGDIPSGLDPSVIKLNTRQIAGKIAPFAPVATGTVASLAMSPVALATGPAAPFVEAGSFGVGYAAGKPIQSFLEKYSKGEPTTPKENPFVETAKSLPEGLTYGMMNPVLGKVIGVAGDKLYKGEEAVRGVVRNAYEKAIRPKVGGKGTDPQKEKFFDDVATAATTHVRMAQDNPNIKLPETVDDMGKLVHEAKINIHSKYSDISKGSASKGAIVDRTDIIDDMNQVANSPELLETYGGKRISATLKRMAKEWSKNPIIDPVRSEKLIASLNADSKAFYRAPNPSEIKLAPAMARYANMLKAKTEESLGRFEGPEWAAYRKEYGAQLAIEKEVNDRATVLARQNLKGFFDLANIPTAGAFVAGLTKLDPGIVAGAAAAKFAKDYIKWVNSPDRIIKGMYKDVRKLIPKPERQTMTPAQKEAFNYIEGKVYEPGGLPYGYLTEKGPMPMGGQLMLPRGAQTMEEMYPRKLLPAPGYIQPEETSNIGSPLIMPNTGVYKAPRPMKLRSSK